MPTQCCPKRDVGSSKSQNRTFDSFVLCEIYCSESESRPDVGDLNAQARLSIVRRGAGVWRDVVNEASLKT
jgi:hypothetical protein